MCGREEGEGVWVEEGEGVSIGGGRGCVGGGGRACVDGRREMVSHVWKERWIL